ncbi:uncharacterized protein LOC111339117 [Stylophora pistillata]|uniref:uncharacterized protein LOC111339117 n=1 Tax=Stylophora pistillata TaxID=50429 RepID=UPI000C056D5E|nr:uncharacterized protein LOC111339117 [Stylophora pistillata]
MWEMADSTWCKLVFKSQTALGVISVYFLHCIAECHSCHSTSFIMPVIDLTSAAIPNPVILTEYTCYNNYIDMISKPHGLIPLNVVALTLSVLCASWICFAIFGAVLLRKIKSSRDNVKTRKTFRCIYFIHVFFRLFFLGGMLGLSCSYPTINLPSTYKCEVHQTPQNNNQTTQSSIHPTKVTLHCKDLHYKQKSMLNRVIIAVDVLYMMCGILEVLYMWCTEGPVEQKLLGDLENVELGPLLESKYIK